MGKEVKKSADKMKLKTSKKVEKTSSGLGIGIWTDSSLMALSLGETSRFDQLARKIVLSFFSCKTPKIVSEPSVSLSSDLVSIRARIEELVSNFSVRDLVEEFICLGVRPLSSGWALNFGILPGNATSVLPPFVVDHDLVLPEDVDEYLKYLTLQKGKRQNPVFAALVADIPARVHPEQVPELGKKIKGKAKELSYNDDDVDIEGT
uniref:Uncharacterized protein n=1 Tax=Oryza punctata TaxID=4537 RepID=A0A0E0KAZ4_ORYPU